MYLFFTTLHTSPIFFFTSIQTSATFHFRPLNDHQSKQLAVSEMHEDVLAVRIASLLKDLLQIEDEAAHHARSRDSKEAHYQEDTLLEARSMFIMRVPYVGTIKLSRQGITAVPLASMEQDEGSWSPSQHFTRSWLSPL